ncbi:hypothetical protein [Reyranella sp.]|uniref:hypothetical protein n=1 Tax=Reyranella sp. TaxID=1929291 RepID=UPI001225A0DD|nr:hypothetical protein [Reyranella sp.]TAJ84705.1 MAG: hypothetical protein EPO50_18665 [Reyranella sp.]
MSSQWTIAQACVWIATRDERLVNAVDARDLLANAEDFVAARTLPPLDETEVGDKKTPTPVADACVALLEACQAAAIVVYGRRRGVAPIVIVPGDDWVNLEIRDDASRGVVAASSEDRSLTSQWWDNLLLLADAVVRHWALPRRRRSANVYAQDWRPDRVGDAVWAERRQRKVQHEPPMQLRLDEDGLLDAVEVTLVEAVTWCAFGKAIPTVGWMVGETIKRSDEDYAIARNSYADSLYGFREADRRVRATEARFRSSELTSLRGYAAQDAVERRNAMQRALAAFAKQASWRQLIVQTCEDFRQAHDIPTSDAGFINRLADQWELKLLQAFQRGQLQCLGRRDGSILEWEALPKECFRLPLTIQLAKNNFGISDHATDEERALVSVHVSNWIDLRVDVQQLRAWRSGIGISATPLPNFEYVNKERLEALRRLSGDKFDLKKLIRLCEELNSNYNAQNYLSTAILLRAILDHVPPLFGYKGFQEVTANYAGERSFKEAMTHLNGMSRKIADQLLHGVARRSDALPNATQVNFSQGLDVLLAEIERLLGEDANTNDG